MVGPELSPKAIFSENLSLGDNMTATLKRADYVSFRRESGARKSFREADLLLAFNPGFGTDTAAWLPTLQDLRERGCACVICGWVGGEGGMGRGLDWSCAGCAFRAWVWMGGWVGRCVICRLRIQSAWRRLRPSAALQDVRPLGLGGVLLLIRLIVRTAAWEQARR